MSQSILESEIILEFENAVDRIFTGEESAEYEYHRAEKLAGKLRQLGVDPEGI